jgi:hypothetical protein
MARPLHSGVTARYTNSTRIWTSATRTTTMRDHSLPLLTSVTPATTRTAPSTIWSQPHAVKFVETRAPSGVVTKTSFRNSAVRPAAAW